MAKISNPRMFAGDQALATRKYVGKISSDLDTRITNVNDTLSGNINDNFNAVKNWLTGYGKNDLTSFGYAYLTDSGKIDPSLIPPISIVHTRTVLLDDILDIVEELQLSTNNDLMTTWLNNTPDRDNYQIGDMIIVTRGDEPPYAAEPGYTDVLGPWIITSANGNYNDDKQIVKLTFPKSEIISVNRSRPDVTTGDVSIPLSSVILVEHNFEKEDVDGAVAAQNLAKAIYMLDYDSILNGRFAIKVQKDGFSEFSTEEYAKLSELNSVSGTLTGDINTIRADVNTNATAIERINGNIGNLSNTVDSLNTNMNFVKRAGVGIDVRNISIILPENRWEKIKSVEKNGASITGDISNITYELEGGQSLYKFSKELSEGETYLALCQNSCPIYPDVYVDEVVNPADGSKLKYLNIVLVITTDSKDDELNGLTLYTLKKLDEMNNA